MLTHLCYAHLSPICLEARCTFNCVWLDAVHEDFEWTEKGLASQHVGIVILQWWPNHVRSWDHSLGMMWDDRDVWRLLKPHCLSRQEALPMGTGCKHAFPPGQWTSLKSPDYVQWCITTISHHARMLSQNEYMQYNNCSTPYTGNTKTLRASIFLSIGQMGRIPQLGRLSASNSVGCKNLSPTQ